MTKVQLANATKELLVNAAVFIWIEIWFDWLQSFSNKQSWYPSTKCLFNFWSLFGCEDFIRNKLNWHFVTQMDINCDIHSKWLSVIQSISQMALKLRFIKGYLMVTSGFFEGQPKHDLVCQILRSNMNVTSF